MWRYPVKSMLGEQVDEVHVAPEGLARDRALAVVDSATGMVATAKHPRLWRDLLTYSARSDGDHVRITSPSGWTLDAPARDVDARLSKALGRVVRICSERPDGASVERPAPEDVLAEGVDARVPAATVRIGQGSPGTTFVDYAPVHLITTATVEEVGTEHLRYRPNLVLRTPSGTPAYVENDWVGRELYVGDGQAGPVLRVTLPTPRCAVPTLEHGALPRAVHAVRTLIASNRVDVPGFGAVPCAGCYVEVVRPGVSRVGDEVTLR
ncbi:MOSC domain-containing protein [Pseudonocardia dioxanivorans]|nr:MOSC N-terminal beta barrel domain-containing protein [Pseudonocardia dioxanivorans]